MAAVLALLSSVLWGSADFLGGLISRRMPALVVVAASQLVALVLIVPIAAVSGGFAHRPLGYLPWGVAAGLIGTLALTSFYYALSIGKMGIVSPISAGGIVVPVLVGLAGGDRPALVQLVGIVAVVVGVVLAGGPDVRTEADEAPHPHEARAVLFAVGAAVGFGITLVALSYGGRIDPLMTVVAQRTASGLLIGIPVLLVLGRHVVHRRDFPQLAAVGIGDGGANALYAWSAATGTLAIVAVFASLFPLVTLMLARTMLHERLSRLQSLGVTVALVGVVLIAGGGA